MGLVFRRRRVSWLARSLLMTLRGFEWRNRFESFIWKVTTWQLDKDNSESDDYVLTLRWTCCLKSRLKLCGALDTWCLGRNILQIQIVTVGATQSFVPVDVDLRILVTIWGFVEFSNSFTKMIQNFGLVGLNSFFVRLDIEVVAFLVALPEELLHDPRLEGAKRPLCDHFKGQCLTLGEFSALELGCGELYRLKLTDSSNNGSECTINWLWLLRTSILWSKDNSFPEWTLHSLLLLFPRKPFGNPSTRCPWCGLFQSAVLKIWNISWTLVTH